MEFKLAATKNRDDYEKQNILQLITLENFKSGKALLVDYDWWYLA